MPVIQTNKFLLVFTICAYASVLGQSSLRCASISECPPLMQVPEENLKDYQRCDEGQVRQNLILENLPSFVLIKYNRLSGAESRGPNK